MTVNPAGHGTVLAAAGLVSALLGWASGAAAADHSAVARGEYLAQLVCSTCHEVAKDQRFPPMLTKPAPSFFVIANRPDTTATSLRHFISNTHWDVDKLPMTMPNQMLTTKQTLEVAQYILSLRGH